MARDPRSFLEKVKGVLSAIDEAQTALAADSPQTLPLGLTSAYDALRPVQAMCFGVKQYIESVIGGKPSRKPSFSHLRRDVEILARWEEKVLPVCVEPSQKLFAAYYETVVRKAQDLFDPLTDMVLFLLLVKPRCKLMKSFRCRPSTPPGALMAAECHLQKKPTRPEQRQTQYYWKRRLLRAKTEKHQCTVTMSLAFPLD